LKKKKKDRVCRQPYLAGGENAAPPATHKEQRKESRMIPQKEKKRKKKNESVRRDPCRVQKKKKNLSSTKKKREKMSAPREKGAPKGTERKGFLAHEKDCPADRQEEKMRAGGVRDSLKNQRGGLQQMSWRLWGERADFPREEKGRGLGAPYPLC